MTFTFARALLIILIISGIAYTSLALNRAKFNRSEVAYAEISREMLAQSSFIVPLYRGIPCIDKPVFNYWAIIPCFKAFGVSGFSARIPSITAALACLFIFALAVHKLWGWQVSLLSTMILASSQRYWEFASLCMTDMLLTFFDCLTLVSLFIALKSERRRFACFAIAAVSMGLAVLTKGPVGLILPGFSFLLYLLLTRQLSVLSWKLILVGALIFLAVAAPWYVAASAQVNTSASVGAWLWHHNVERFFGSAYAYHYSPFYMLQSLLLGFAPWSIFLPFAAVSAIENLKNQQPAKDLAKRDRQNSPDAHANNAKTNNAETKKAEIKKERIQTELYLWIWLILTTTFFTFSRGKMNYYDLPAFPAAAAIVGVHINDWLQNRNFLGTGGAWLLAFTLMSGAIASAALLPGITIGGIASWVCLPFALLACTLLSIWALLAKRPILAYGAIFGGICAAVTAFSWQIAPSMAKLSPALEYMQIIKHHPEAKIALHSDFAKTVDWFDCALFESHRAPAELDTVADLKSFLSRPEPVLVIVTQSTYAQLPQSLQERTIILERRPYMSAKLDLGFLLKHHGNLVGTVPLLLVSNYKSNQSD